MTFFIAHCARCGLAVQKNYRLSTERKSRPIYCSLECEAVSKRTRASSRRNIYFWTKVDKGDAGNCWTWTGYKDAGGYGRYGRILAHRVAFEILNGRIPDGMVICHTCDNPPCVNPSHLRLGTQPDNIADMIAKGRMAAIPVRRGSDSNKAQLTSSQAIAIFQSRDPIKTLATRFAITTTAIRLIQNGRNWAHATVGLWT